MTRVTVTITEYPARPRLATLAYIALANGCTEAVYRFRMWRLDRSNRRLAARLAVIALAKRADYEHRLYLAGDPRGTYGRYMPCQIPSTKPE